MSMRFRPYRNGPGVIELASSDLHLPRAANAVQSDGTSTLCMTACTYKGEAVVFWTADLCLTRLRTNRSWARVP